MNEEWSAVISLISLSISLLVFFYTVWVNRRRVNLFVRGYRYDFATKRFYIDVSFVNESQSPISINHVELQIEGESYRARYYPYQVFKETSGVESHGVKTVNQMVNTDTATFPIAIQPFMSERSILYFHTLYLEPDDLLKLKNGLCHLTYITSRGTLDKYVRLPDNDITDEVGYIHDFKRR